MGDNHNEAIRRIKEIAGLRAFGNINVGGNVTILYTNGQTSKPIETNDMASTLKSLGKSIYRQEMDRITATTAAATQIPDVPELREQHDLAVLTAVRLVAGTGQTTVELDREINESLDFMFEYNHDYNQPNQRPRWSMPMSGFLPKSNHAAVAVGKTIYSIGGNYHVKPINQNDPCPIDVYVLHVEDSSVLNEWTLLDFQQDANTPTQRINHTAVVHGHFILIWGGYDLKKKKDSNTLYRFDTIDRTWDKPTVKGKNIPATRSYHSAVVIQNQMFVFGGRRSGNVLYSLDLETFTWSIIPRQGINPPRCWDHSAVAYNDRFMFVFSGFDEAKEKSVSSLTCFDADSRIWTYPAISGRTPRSRNRHSACVQNGLMYIFGGYSRENGSCLNDVFSFNPNTLEWNEILPDGGPLSPRKSPGCVAIEDQIFIFGGDDAGAGTWFDDTFVLQTVDNINFIV